MNSVFLNNITVSINFIINIYKEKKNVFSETKITLVKKTTFFWDANIYKLRSLFFLSQMCLGRNLSKHVFLLLGFWLLMLNWGWMLYMCIRCFQHMKLFHVFCSTMCHQRSSIPIAPSLSLFIYVDIVGFFLGPNHFSVSFNVLSVRLLESINKRVKRMWSKMGTSYSSSLTFLVEGRSKTTFSFICSCLLCMEFVFYDRCHPCCTIFRSFFMM